MRRPPKFFRPIFDLIAITSLMGAFVCQGLAQNSQRVEAPTTPPTPTNPPATPASLTTTPPQNPTSAPVRAMPTAPPPQASGNLPPAAGFARQDGTPGLPLRATPATLGMVNRPVINNVPPTRPAKPMGTSVSAMQSRGSVIENTRPERVKVFPDDPESAWWEINPSYAFARAQREQKPLLLLFTGMWNTQAMALSKEVFATKSFNKYVKEHLIICYLVYPRNITDAPDSLRRVKEKFKVRGYPNVLIFNPNGEVERGIRGYRTGRPVDYFWELKNTCQPVLESIKTQKQGLVRYGYRDWSNFREKVIFAKFVDRDQTWARLQDVSGEIWTIKINDLAPDDQRLVESFPSKESVLPKPEEEAP